MRNLVPIGRFSKVCLLTVTALRLYDELGLLRPAMTDPDTGYRYYSLAQAQDAERIRRLRDVELPLEEIKAVLAERDVAAVRDRLETHRRRLQEKELACRRELASLDRLIEQQGHAPAYEVKVRDMVTQAIVSVRGHVPMSGMPEFFQRAYRDIFGLIGSVGVRPAGSPVSIYHDPEFRDDDVDVEVAVPVSEPVEGAGRVVFGALAGGPVAYTLHVGPFDEIGNAYTALAEWTQAHGHEPAGPPRECYLTDPQTTPNPAEYRTEVIWPIK